jgi:nitrate reductase gamma subunit
MSWYELLLFLHILAIATWFGSGLAIMVLATRAQNVEGPAFGTFAINAGWWAGRAHPAAGVVLLLTGFGMVAEADISIGETWIVLALVGLVVAFGVGGALTGRTSDQLTKALEGSGGNYSAEHRDLAQQVILYSRIELAVLVLVIADMVAKPGA